MTESIQLSEATNIIQENHQITNILNTHFLSIGIPSIEDYNYHASISGIKENFTPAEEFNFKLVSKIQVERKIQVEELLKTLVFEKPLGVIKLLPGP